MQTLAMLHLIVGLSGWVVSPNSDRRWGVCCFDIGDGIDKQSQSHPVQEAVFPLAVALDLIYDALHCAYQNAK